MARVIINGDDFGMTESCSEAILQALSRKLITHTSIVANGGFFDEAVELARQNAFTDRIGIHFNLTEGEPLTEAICRLPDFVRDGSFCKRFLQAPRPLSVAEQEAIYAELSAQIRKAFAAGIPLTHADSHHYIHTFTNVAPIAAAVCKENHIARIRLNRTFDTPEHPRMTKDRIDNSFWREQGFLTTAFFGRLSDFIDTAVPDDTEIMVHPDFDRDGNLIDRARFTDGIPVGVPLVPPKLPEN